MSIKKVVTGFIKSFAITLLVTLGVTYLWGLLFRRVVIIDWETSFRFATIFGIIFSIIDSKKRLKPESDSSI
jgi:hypothetical protein